MTNSTHTPGPWKQIVLDGERYINPSREDGEFALIAKVVRSTSKANARLIAAAPDLFSALEWVTRCAKMNGPAGTTAYFISDEAMDKARTAIAKATGETK